MRNVIRVVRKIAIHFKNEFVIVFQCPFETGDVRAAQTIFLRLMKNVDWRMLRRESVRNFGRAIRRFAVHDQQFHLHRQSQKPLHQREEIVALVIGGDDDQSFGVHAGNSADRQLSEDAPENKRGIGG